MSPHTTADLGRAAFPVFAGGVLVALPTIATTQRLAALLSTHVADPAAHVLLFLALCTLAPTVASFALSAVLVVDRLLPGDSPITV